jgi:iron-sulfur cluster assembly protein
MGILVTMINVTDAAAAQIKRLAENTDSPAAGLRIFVERGGCSGLQYTMTIAPPEPEDITIECADAAVYLDAEAQRYLKGSVIDYSNDLNNTGFKITNPNAKQTCGCGTSFEA